MSQLDELREFKKLTEDRLDDKTFGDRAKEIRRLEKEAEDKAFNERRERNKAQLKSVNELFLEAHRSDIAMAKEKKTLEAMKRKVQDERTVEMAQESRERLGQEIIH